MRDESLQAFLDAVPAAFRPERAGDLSVKAVLDTGDEIWSMVIEKGTCTLSEGDIPDADLRLRASEKHLLRVLQGTMNPLIAYTTGKLRLEGDVNLALSLVKLFDF